jgi:hypothetical protein
MSVEAKAADFLSFSRARANEKKNGRYCFAL